ncbi:MAG: T9SS type A sorting domain-containing protein [Bacteroidia bacterium]|nr:T9SS type A sorting domain-containing protein [Bacteroidia bacterium]
MKNLALFLFLICRLNTVNAQLVGQFTVGGSNPDYATINDAVNDVILQGVQGPVTFMIRPGIYSAFLNFPELNHSFEVEFRSESGDPDDVQLTMSNLYECRNVTFRNMTVIPRRNTNYMYNYKGLEISGSSYITFDSCIVRGTSSADERIGFTVAADWGYISITNCTFRNLDYGIVYSSSTHYYGSNRHYYDHLIQFCDFDSVQTCIRLAGDFGSAGDSMRIYDCKMTNCDIGILADGSAEDIRNLWICKNVINSLNAGVIISNNFLTNAYDMPMLINNMISAPVAFSSPSARYSGLYNNSFYGQTSVGAYYWCYNNSFYYNGTSQVFAIYDTLTYHGNNNNFYAPNSAPNMFVVTSQLALSLPDLQSWQIASNEDTVSISTSPYYVSSSDLHSYSPDLKFHGKQLAWVTEDIDGEPRNGVPDIGADEYHASLLPPHAFHTVLCNTSGNYTATFIDTSVRAVSFWWDFDDATTSSNQSPSHAWTGPGPFNIKHAVFNPFGNDTAITSFSFIQTVPIVAVNGYQLSVTNGSYTAYQWMFNGTPIMNATGSSYTAPFAGNYTVIVWDATCTCPYESPVIAVGVEEMSTESFLLQPNPAADNCLISIPATEGEWSCAVFNAAGMVIDERDGLNGSLILSTGLWENGVYFIRVSHYSQTFTRKLIVLH